jgi:hypothetical protein
MSALDFPASPSIGQQATLTNGFTYQWDGAVWALAASTGQAAGGDLAGTYPNPTVNNVNRSKLSGTVEGARISRPAVQSIPASTWTMISFSTDISNGRFTNLWNAGTPDRIVVQNAGIYLVGGNVALVAGTGGQRLLTLTSPGVTQHLLSVPVATANWIANVIWSLGAGAYVQMGIWHDSSTALNTDHAYSPPTMWVTRIG